MDVITARDRPALLLADDHPREVLLFREAVDGLARCARPFALNVVADGEAALDFLHRRPPFQRAPRPALVVLDLALPRKDGLTVLAEVKADPDLRVIPVCAYADAAPDVRACYRLRANCCVPKPASLAAMVRFLQALDAFWFDAATLPATP
jgi:CheY-like chemotaxis protein